MNRRQLCCVFCLPAILLGTSLSRAGEPRSGDTVTQVSTIDALLAGAYDGQMPCGALLTYGDLGIGTFDKLDGEMIVLDGKVYQARADGTVVRSPEGCATPFASVAAFQADGEASVTEPVNLEGLQGRIDALAPNSNLFVAIRVQGRFSHMKVRSVPAQQKPYPPLAEVTKHQPVFELQNVTGTLVGFRSPAFVKGINVPGYHLHFLSDDLQKGGHVLEFTLEGGTVRTDTCHRFTMILPEGDSSAFGQIDLGRDRSGELQRVEK